MTRQAASNLLNGNAGLSAEMAIRFEKAENGRSTTAFDIALEAEVASYCGCHTGLPVINPAEFHP